MPININEQDFNKYTTSLYYHHGLAVIKNPELVYIAANKSVVKITGFTDLDDMVGRTDYDMRCPASESAAILRRIDQYVLSNQVDSKYLAFNQYTTGWEILLEHHTVICNERNESIAVLAAAQTITHDSITKIGLAFNRILCDRIKKRKSFYISLEKKYPQLSLTQRQAQILLYIINGFSAKEAANVLKLSCKTIDRHMDDIKIKLGCRTKSQLIEKAINEGLLDIYIDA